MKRLMAFAALACALAPAAEAAAPSSKVSFDKASHTVRFTAKATGISTNETLEFIAIGPLSGHAYEAMAVTDASPAEIAAAMESTGIPRGIPSDSREARFWPCGEKLSFAAEAGGRRFALHDLVADTREAEEGPQLSRGPLASGGERLADGTPVASTNEPCAVFALYNCGQSLVSLPGPLLQSDAFGRFRAKTAFAQGTPLEITLSWDGKKRTSRRDVLISSAPDGTVRLQIAADGGKPETFDPAEALKKIRADADAGADIYLTPGFAHGFPLVKAREMASALMMLDGKGVKIAGKYGKQPYMQAYLPDESWRERKNRPFQPFEIRVAPDGKKTFTYVYEDWSAPGAEEPVLDPRTKPFAEWSELPALIAACGPGAEKIDAALFFVPAGAATGLFLDGAAALPEQIAAVYVFAGDK